MAHTYTDYDERLAAEIQQIPKECLPALIDIVHAFREGVTALPSAEDSFRESWKDVMEGRTYPIETLWDGIDAE